MKKLIFIVASILISCAGFAQDEQENGWEKGGQGSLQFSQAALSNWAAGGENALSLNAFLNLYANYSREKLHWDNSLNMGYGFLYRKPEMQKTDDKLDMASIFGYQASGNWSYSGMFSFKTQLTGGYADTVRISGLMSPAYVLLSLGMEYKPQPDLSVFIAPLTAKMTFVADPVLSAAGSFGVSAGKKFRAEFGGFVKFSYKKEIMENVVFQTKCELFSNYLNDPQFIDVNWDALLSMKINKYLSANLSTQLIYDHDIDIEHETADGSVVTGPVVQFKEMFAFGLSLSF